MQPHDIVVNGTAAAGEGAATMAAASGFARASGIAHIGQTVMAAKGRDAPRYFMNITFNDPTMAEACRVAAHNGLNRLA